MSIKQILVSAHKAEAAAAGLRAAAIIAEAHDAHICAVHIRQRPAAILPEGYYGLSPVLLAAHAEEIERAIGEKAAAVKASAAHAMSGAAVSWEWREEEGTVSALTLHSRVSDLTVFGRLGGDLEFEEAALIEETLFQSGGPVLLCPPDAMRSEPRRIVLAWNGTREAARALSASLPFLRRAVSVAIVAFGDPPADSPGPEAAARLLARHGVSVETQARPRDDRDADHLLQEAKRFRADLVVMGAYSHARWRQIVLGGFTRTMLKQTEIPVLMAH
jgi:nucleotide-binding universal stress UspA family protein